MRLAHDRWVLAATGVVVLAVAAGLVALGPPDRARGLRLDERRTVDLHAVAAAIDLYWTRRARLPESLEELEREPGVRVTLADPRSGEPYEYRPLDEARYEICARFAQPSAGTSRLTQTVPRALQTSCQACHGPGRLEPDDPAAPSTPHARRWQLFAHEAGRQCFVLRAEPIARSSEVESALTRDQG